MNTTEETSIEIGVVAAGVALTLGGIIWTKFKDKLFEHVLVKVVPSIRKFSLGSLKRNSDIDASVIKYLTELRVLTGASRASYMEMKNGGKNSAGTCFRRMSMIHEICDNGVLTTKSKSQSMDVSAFPELVSVLVGDDNVAVLCASALGDGEALALANVRGIKCGLLLHRLTTKRFGVIRLDGFVALTFLHQQCTEEHPECVIGNGENIVHIQKTTALIKSKLEQEI